MSESPSITDSVLSPPLTTVIRGLGSGVSCAGGGGPRTDSAIMLGFDVGNTVVAGMG
jgi:hypothetical protein